MHFNEDPGARVAAFMHPVVNQPGVPPHGYPLTSGVEIGLCRYRILKVAEMVARVRQKFDQGDTEVGNMPLAPLRLSTMAP